ncbi:MAG: hypothetical protein HY985_17995 [Magnetospirillum sp.]|nr:hypothetical protein [Magnetospirillum sp.]
MIRTGAFLGVVLFAAGASGAEEKVVITRADCQRIVRHVPGADVAYQPGVDVHGRKVVGADLPDSGNVIAQKMIPEVLEIPITINPVNWAERNAANKQKAAAEAAIAASAQAKVTAAAELGTLTGQRTTLLAQSTTLASELTTLNTTLATMQAEVAAGTRFRYNKEYLAAQSAVTAKQAEIATNTSALATNATALATRNAVLDPAAAQLTTLTTQQTTLQTQATTLTTELATLSATLATLQAEVTAGTRFRYNKEYLAAQSAVTAKQAEIATNTSAIATNAAAVAAQQAIVDAPATQSTSEIQKTSAEATLSGLSAKGFDSVTMSAGTVKFDILKGTFTFNGEPMGAADQSALAEACRKRGVK